MKKYIGTLYLVGVFLLFDIGQLKANSYMINMGLFGIYVYLVPFLFIFFLDKQEIKEIKEKRKNGLLTKVLTVFFAFELAAFGYFITAFLLISTLFVLKIFFGNRKEEYK